MIRGVRRPSAIVLVLAVVVAALANAGVFAEENQQVDFSHRNVTPATYCSPLNDPVADQSSPAAGATPIVSGTPAGLAAGDLRIQATDSRRLTTSQALPYKLRLYSVVIPIDGPFPERMELPTCEVGYSIILVESGELQLTHHPSSEGTPTPDEAGAVSFVQSPALTSQLLPAGAPSITLKAGDSVFIENAIISYRPLGTTDLHLLIAGVSPEWLPCHGGGCG